MSYRGRAPRPGAARDAGALTVLALVLAAVVAACGGPWLPVPTTADATRAQARWPGTTVDELSRGRTLLIRRCSSCHQSPSPSDLPSDRWPAEVDEMAERSGLRAGESPLITRYLTAFARDQVAP